MIVRPPLALVGADDGVELGLLVAAVLTVIILAALWIVTAWVAKTFLKVPFVGKYIAKGFDWASRWARGAMMATLHATLWALGKIAHSVMVLITNSLHLLKDLGDAIMNALEHTVYVVIRRTSASDRQFATKQASNALITALQYAKSVEQQARKLADSAYARAHAEVRQLAQQTTKTFQVFGAEMLKLLQAEQARADQQFRQAEADARKMFGQAEADAQQYAQAAVQQAVKVAEADADKLAAAAWTGQWAEITAGVTAALTALGPDMPDLARQLKVIVAVEPATLAEAEAAAAAAVPPMLTALQDCVIPDCRDLGQLRKSLHTLADIAFFAALLAWLIQMVHDPGGWARETYAVLGPVAAGEVTVVRGVMGI